MTVTQRLFLLVAIALLPALAIQGYNELDLRRTREREVREMALRQAQLAASELERIFEGIRSLLTAVAEVPSVRALHSPACVAFLATLQPKVPYLLTIAALDLEGHMACRQTPPPTDVSFADWSYFREAIASGGFTIGEYAIERTAGTPVLGLVLPLREPNGRIKGVVAAALDLRWLGERLRERALPPGGSLTIADRNGMILAREPFPERFVGTPIPESFRRLVDASEAGTTELTSQDGMRRVVGYVPTSLPPRNIYVSAGLSWVEAFAAVNRATSRGVALLAAGLLLALCAAWLAGRYVIRRPIERLLAAANAWRLGDYSLRTGLTARWGEIGALGRGLRPNGR